MRSGNKTIEFQTKEQLEFIDLTDQIKEFVKKSGITEKVKHRKIVIPGFVAAVSGDLEEELGSGWEVRIGPREAAHLAPFLKQGL